MKRRVFATILFTAVLLFCMAEVFMICTAKSHHDYTGAKRSSEELSVELSLLSASFTAGNRTLYDDALSRYRATLADFSGNDYVATSQNELLSSLTDYRNLLESNPDEIAELLELSAALSGIRSELQSNESQKLDAANFYQVRQTFQNLLNVLEGIKSENFEHVKNRLKSFASKIIALSENAATCVSVCPKSTFEAKSAELDAIKIKYLEEFESLGLDASKKYDPSELIVQLGKI